MDELDDVTEAFDSIEDGDSVMYQSEYGIRDEATVMDDTPPMPDGSDPELSNTQYIFGRPENCEMLVYNFGVPQKAGIASDGSLTGWKEITGIINHTQGYYAGDLSEGLIESAEQ